MTTVALGALLTDDCQTVEVDRFALPAGDAGIDVTLDVMRQLIATGMSHPVVRRHAEYAVRAVPPADFLGQIAAICSYLQSRVRYTRDPVNTEYLQTPWNVLRCGVEQGTRPGLDCDDLTMVSLALCGAIGFEVQIVVVSTLPSGEWNHVRGAAQLPDGVWVPVDLTYAWRGGDPRRQAETRSAEVAV